MKNILLLICISTANNLAFAQEKKLYVPNADAASGIVKSIKMAALQKKHVLLQAGGNWCGWCIEFNRFCQADTQVNALLKRNFIVYHLNWSRENENKAIFEKYGYPQRFGFPVLIVLNSRGEQIHTQNTEYLEDGNKSYNREKVLSFLKNWSPKAIDPGTYKE